MSVAFEVREALDIETVAREYTTLKNAGSELRGACPIHRGTHPNFSVSSSKQVFFCHTCKAGGDVISLVKLADNITYRAALEQLAERAGIDLHEEEREDTKGLRMAAEFFSDWCKSSIEDSGEVLSYLNEKGVKPEFAHGLGVGYMSDGEAFLEAARDHNVSIEDLETLGLVRKGNDGPFVSLKNRLIVTIYDQVGRVSGFSGRRIGKYGPKWMNSPGSPIFSRQNVLYGANWAKEAGSSSCIVTEGFFDVIAMKAAGYPNVVATMGTSMTERQAAVASTYWDDGYVMYDGDRPGVVASFKAADLLLEQGIYARICSLPDGVDPGDAMSQKEGIDTALEEAQDAMDLKIAHLKKSKLLDTTDGKVKAFDKLQATVAATYDKVVQDLYAKKVADLLGIRHDTVLDAAKRKKKIRPVLISEDVASVEDMAIDFCRADEIYLEQMISAGVTPADFKDAAKAREYRYLFDRYGLSDDSQGGLTRFTEDMWQECFRVFLKRVRDRQVAELQASLPLTEGVDKIGVLKQIVYLKAITLG